MLKAITAIELEKQYTIGLMKMVYSYQYWYTDEKTCLKILYYVYKY